MDGWGPDEWAVVWQSAPAHLLEGRDGGGHSATAVAGDGSAAGAPLAGTASAAGLALQAAACGNDRSPTSTRGTAARRPPDGRPPLGHSPGRRPKLTRRTAGIRGSQSPQSSPAAEGSSDGGDGVDLESLAARIRGMAADLAASACQWLHLVEEFDRERGWAKAGLRSCAAWLSWTCSVAPGTAREYVRVARMLSLLPLVDEAFAAGRLSYSKVRILAQVAAEVDESVLLQQAQVQTVSQLERTVRAYRRTEGWSQQRKRRATWRWDDDGMLVLSARLPADEGALLVAALERARDDIAPVPDELCGRAGGSAPDDGGMSTGDGVPATDGGMSDGDEVPAGDGMSGGADARRSGARHQMPQPSGEDRQRAALTGADPLGTVGADILVALAERALAAGEVDSSGDDRHLLVLHADLDQLIGDDESAESSAEGDVEPDIRGDVESGAERDTVSPRGAIGSSSGRHSRRRTAVGSILARPRCHLENGPGLDRRTAQRIACDAALVAVLHHVGEGEPLRLGRKTRTISPAQRRALRIRDGGCRFPGCHRRGHLEAHHVRHWSLLGPTDLENLVLLCRAHHMLIHEGGFRVSSGPDGCWEFHDPRGAPVPAAPPLPGSATGGAVPSGAPDPLGLLPGWAGEPFHLAETVAVLSRHPRPVAGQPAPVQGGVRR